MRQMLYWIEMDNYGFLIKWTVVLYVIYGGWTCTGAAQTLAISIFLNTRPPTNQTNMINMF